MTNPIETCCYCHVPIELRPGVFRPVWTAIETGTTGCWAAHRPEPD